MLPIYFRNTTVEANNVHQAYVLGGAKVADPA